jgi:alpha-2-macroglobulin
MRRTTWRGLLCGCLVLALAQCGGKDKEKTGEPPPRATRKAPLGPGLQLRLEEGPAPEGAQASARRAPATNLSDAETQTLLKRLKPIAVEEGDVQSFALRPGSMKPPRAGATVQGAFPPPTKPAVPDPGEAGPLQVLRFGPDGDITLAPNLSVTFSQPMVAVTSHADSVAKGVPVKLTPTVPGTWRWVGTKTVLLEPKIRFPMATAFRAEVPAGTTSSTGGKLAAAKSWTFTTPAPRLLVSHPSGGPQRLDSLIFIGFDQAIDPDAVSKTTRVEAGGQSIEVARASDAEIEQDEAVTSIVQGAEKGRFLVLRPKAPLAPATDYTVTVGPGTPSAEGPLKTKDAQTFTFRTYDRLQVQYRSCTTSKCTPLQPLTLSFNNQLDEEEFDPQTIKVSPAIPEMRVVASYSTISISGTTRGNTTYRVTLPASLADVYGQHLGKEEVWDMPVGRADPSLFAPGGDFLVLDPSGDKAFTFYSTNYRELDLRVHSVDPSDWGKYLEFMREGMRQKVVRPLPGKPRIVRRFQPTGEPDELIENRVDLKAALDGGYGQLLVLISERPLPVEPWKRHYLLAWVQVTDLGLDAAADSSQLVSWVTQLRDGSAVSGARVSLLPGGPSASSDAGGLATLPLGGVTASSVLVAQRGRDRAMLPENRSYWGSGGVWSRRYNPGEIVSWFVFDDRKLYKPGEEVRIKGWARVVNLRRGGGVQALPAGARNVSYEVFEPRGNKVAKGTTTIGTLGGFDFKFSLPATVNLGYARVMLSLSEGGVSGSHYHSFQIQEFRRPEFEVASTASEGPHLIGGHADVAVTASYFAGGALPGADVTWQVTASPGYFTPPNQSDYTFSSTRDTYWYYQPPPLAQTKSLAGKTDGRGVHRLRVHFAVGSGRAAAAPPTGPAAQQRVGARGRGQTGGVIRRDRDDAPRPVTIQATATVLDVNRQSWTTTANVLVHPARLYVGLKSDRYFVERGQPMKIDAVVADLEGKLVAGRPIAVRAMRLDYRRAHGSWREEEVDPQTCNVTSATKAVQCTFQTPKGGSYVVEATIQDADGRANQATLTRWVSGGAMPPSRGLEVQAVKLIADRTTYQPGDTAEILVQSPFGPAEGLMTLRRSGILETRRFRVEGTSATLRVPIKEEYLPNVHLRVDVVGAARRRNDLGEEDTKLPLRPALASGELSLSVPALKRELKLEVKPQHAKLEPGGETSIVVTVRDAQQRPVADGEVALVVVDEALLALTGYSLLSPLSTFYPYRPSGASDLHLRSSVVLADPRALLAKQGNFAPNQAAGEGYGHGLGGLGLRGTGAGGGGRSRYAIGGPPGRPAPSAAPAPPSDAPATAKRMEKGGGDHDGNAPAIAVRKDFNALALFAPALRTDAQGQAKTTLKLPDSLTRYRIMAVAVATERFYGAGESTVTARLPLMVRPSAPRFLNFGDRFELPVVLQNQTDAPLTAQVAVRGSNISLTQGAGRKVTIPANDRVEVRFPAAAAEAGTARLQIATAAGAWTDAAELSLPVWTPATTEAFATYGTLDKGAMVQPVQLPKDVVRSFGGVEIGTSSTELQALTDAVLYLTSYPFECSEQLSSRILAVAALRDVLTAFKAKGMRSAEAITAAVDRDLKRLQGMQNYDGGFALWERGKPSWPFVANHVTHALVRAKAKGFTVSPVMMQSALGYLRAIESHIPGYYGPEARRAIVAYSLYVRALASDVDVSKAKSLLAEFKAQKHLSLEGIAWIYPVLSGRPDAAAEVAEIRRLITSRVSETAATAQFATAYGDSAYLLMYSDRRVDALLLEGLIKDQPKSDLIVKLVRGLLGHRKEGRWASTQENAWVLLAMDRYFATYEKATPNFVARAWLGEQFAGEHRFRGRTTERFAIDIPMKNLAAAGERADLIVAKQGPGRLYYRIGMTYAPSDLRPPPASHGFVVERVYEAVDNPKDVQRGKDGTWVVRAGARVRVRLTLVAPARRYHVALIDPLPAGLEALNSALLGAQTTPGMAANDATNALGSLATTNASIFSRRGRGFIGGPSYYWGWSSRWYEHENLRDERAEAFASLLWEGVHTYSYLARATTPGTFVVPPPKAEEMYHPETFGRGAGDKLIVE